MSEQYNEIGETAGKIYRALEQNGPKMTLALQREANIPDELLFNQALGWLAREGKIEFQKKGKGWVVALVGVCAS